MKEKCSLVVFKVSIIVHLAIHLRVDEKPVLAISFFNPMCERLKRMT